MATGKATGNPTVTGRVTIRKCEALEEMQAWFALQKEVWNFSDADLVPVRLFVVANKIGGQVVGAFDGEELVGFALALPGNRNGHSYLHSQMLAVRQKYRNAGLGRQLKLSQRKDALARGFDLMEWTFDPLEIKNAYLNIEKLGAIARRYNANQYGITTSPLQGGLPTDRLVAEWWLKSRRGGVGLTGAQRAEVVSQASATLPAGVYEGERSAATRASAVKIQQKNREQFIKAFAEGLAVLGFARDSHGNGHFLLDVWDEARMY